MSMLTFSPRIHFTTENFEHKLSQIFPVVGRKMITQANMNCSFRDKDLRSFPSDELKTLFDFGFGIMKYKNYDFQTSEV